MSCPICGKDTDQKYRPFCSRRCADVDLARWLNESYRIPDEVAGEDDISSDHLEGRENELPKGRPH